MNQIEIFLLLINVFLLTFLLIPLWIIKMKRVGFLWEDMNKFGHPKNVAASGGIIVVFVFFIGTIIYAFLEKNHFAEIFALLSTILFLSLVGLVDDVLGWKKGGMTKKSRLFLALLASIPIILISFSRSMINLPFFGEINAGIFYPLFFIPLGIVGASTTYNFLAGFNGLEASQGIIFLSALAITTYITGNVWLAVISLIMIFPLIAFYFFNKSPAKVFPGDTLTLAIGGLIAITCIFGSIEKIAFFFFIPYVVEVVLKSRGKLEKHSFGKPKKNGSLETPYEKIYGLTHFSIYLLKKIKSDKRVYENEVVYLINLFQIFIILLGFWIFF